MEDCIKWGAALSRAVANGILREGIINACIILSGGIDSTFTALSVEGQVRLHGVTVLTGPSAPDADYAREAVSATGIPHTTVVLTDCLAGECVDTVIKALKTIDPIEVACDVPLVAALRACRRLGYSVAITGDGGDELFIGYSFLFRRGVDGVRDWLKYAITSAKFSSVPLGRRLGVRVVTGLYTKPVKRLSRVIPIECRVREVGGRVWGKLLMREYLSMQGLPKVAWRRKTPLLQGSGTQELLRAWASRVGRGEAEELSTKYGIKLPSLPHAYLLRRLVELGLSPPPKCPDPSRRCPTCGACLEGRFCSFCGTYVGRDGVAYHYSGP